MRGWPSEYLRAMIFFSFCCLFAADVAAGIVGLAEGTRSSWWSIVRHVRIEKRVIDSHTDHHHHSGNHAFEHFLDNPPSPRAGLRFAWPRCWPPSCSLVSSFSTSLSLAASPSTNQTPVWSGFLVTGPPYLTRPPLAAPMPPPQSPQPG